MADDEQRCGDGERHDHPDAERDERGQRRGGLAHIVGLARANAFGDALHLVDLGANGVHRDLAAVGGRHHGRRIGVAGAQILEIPANQSELGLAQSKELVDQRRGDLGPRESGRIVANRLCIAGNLGQRVPVGRKIILAAHQLIAA